MSILVGWTADHGWMFRQVQWSSIYRMAALGAQDLMRQVQVTGRELSNQLRERRRHCCSMIRCLLNFHMKWNHIIPIPMHDKDGIRADR